MKLFYYEDKELSLSKKRIFLAGPTPRDDSVLGWRQDAIKILLNLNFDGDVYIPEFKDKKISGNLDYAGIIDWEQERLHDANVILFYIPRELDTMPAFTTNVEFGYFLKSGKVFYARPENAPKNKYLDYMYHKEYGKWPKDNLNEIITDILDFFNLDNKKIFFTSDTHFKSERTFKFSKRPFKNVEEMDRILIDNWNRRVGINDTVYHLGDFGDLSTVKKLNEKITLILGNYEEDDLSIRFNGDFNKYKKYLIDLGFNDVIKGGHFVKLDRKKAYLTHKPMDCKPNEFNLFGHIHEKQMVKKFGLNVGVDCCKFMPFSLEDVLFYKNAIENFCDEN